MTTSNKPLAAVCGAKCRVGPKQIAKAAAAGPKALEKLLKRTYCQRAPVPGRTRCHLHGGYSTGPTSPEGIARCAANLRPRPLNGFCPKRRSRKAVKARTREISARIAQRRMLSAAAQGAI